MIPLRILHQRSLMASCLFTALINMSADTQIYYLPFYFQAVKNTSAEVSGVRILPYLVAVFSTALVTGSCITAFGHYVPLMWLGAAVLTVGCGLIHTLGLVSSEGQWFGYQVIAGIGFGMAFQIPYSVVHVVLPAEDVPMGNALIVFSQALGGALAVSIAQNILSNSLNRRFRSVPGIHSTELIAAGAADISSKVPAGLVSTVREAYSFALSCTYILPIAAGGTAFLCSLFMEWRTLEKPKKKVTSDEVGALRERDGRIIDDKDERGG